MIETFGDFFRVAAQNVRERAALTRLENVMRTGTQAEALVHAMLTYTVMPVTTHKLRPNKTTWVMKNEDGELQPIHVRDMTDDHLRRWVHYFRRKVLGTAPKLTVREADVLICQTIVTGEAIYQMCADKGLMPLIDNTFVKPPPSPPSVIVQEAKELPTMLTAHVAKKKKKVIVPPPTLPIVRRPAPGARLITLGDDDD